MRTHASARARAGFGRAALEEQRAAAGARREREQSAYFVSFEVEVLGFLRFAAASGRPRAALLGV